MGVGAEDENDAMLINALGKDNGDISKDVKAQVDKAVATAQAETQAGVGASLYTSSINS